MHGVQGPLRGVCGRLGCPPGSAASSICARPAPRAASPSSPKKEAVTRDTDSARLTAPSGPKGSSPPFGFRIRINRHNRRKRCEIRPVPVSGVRAATHPVLHLHDGCPARGIPATVWPSGIGFSGRLLPPPVFRCSLRTTPVFSQEKEACVRQRTVLSRCLPWHDCFNPCSEDFGG